MADSAAAIACGALLILAHFALFATAPEMLRMRVDSLYVPTVGEVMFWLDHALLIFPGACLIGWGLSPRLGPWLRRTAARVAALPRREQIAGLVILAVLAMLVARLGHLFILQDYALTDDETAVRYGGQVLASGHLMAPLPDLVDAVPHRFFYIHDGRATSFDWPGAQVAWAVAELTGLGPLVFSAMAALPVACLGLLLGGLLGPAYGLAAALLFMLSPMAFCLSLTTHPHLLSRGFLAAALCAYAFAQQRGSTRLFALSGLGLGLAFTCRPPEIGFLAAPLLVDHLVRAVRGEAGARCSLAALLAGAAGPVALFAVHSFLLTGNPLVPPRFAPGAHGDKYPHWALWRRLGGNLGYNLQMLLVWFLGPLGLILVAAGALRSRFTRLLGLGVLAVLGLALLHDVPGIHAAGPMHYSECSVPLMVLAVHGLRNLVEWGRRHAAALDGPLSAFAAAAVLGLGLFNGAYARTLHRQADVQAYFYGAIDEAVRQGEGPAVVLAPPLVAFWLHSPLAPYGCNVGDWRRPRPDLSDPVLILHDARGAEAMARARFAGRRIFRMTPQEQAPYYKIEPLAR